MIEWNIGLGSLAEIFVLALSVAAVLYGISVQKRRDREVARREIYQRLELASIDLFRFEADHIDLIRPLYSGDPPPADPAAAHAYRNYICQILNLFEMAMELCCSDVIDDEVFGSWIPWFEELGQAPGFAPLWRAGLRDNYTGSLAAVMDIAILPDREGFHERVAALVHEESCARGFRRPRRFRRRG